jgi:regulator of sigma E protease
MLLQLIAFIPILSLMMVVHELGHFFTARRAGIIVQEFGFGLPPRIFGVERGGVIYSLNWIPFGAFVKMLGEEDPTEPGSFARQSKLTRAIVLIAGSAMNFALAVVAFGLAYMTGWPTPIQNEVAIVRVGPDTPAAAAGLREGDRVVSLAGQPITSTDEFRATTQQNLGRQTTLVVMRDGQELRLEITPRANPPEGQGAMGIAISPPTRLQPHNPLESAGFGFTQTLRVIGMTLSAPIGVLAGTLSPELVRPIGLPGMAQVAGDAAQAAIDTGALLPLLTVLGTFSAGLSIANMLPIPALDGGRLLFVLIEAIRGRKVSPDRENAFHFVGIVVLITLMILISLNDINNPLPSIDWAPR